MAEENNEVVDTSESSTMAGQVAAPTPTAVDLDQTVKVGGKEYSARELAEEAWAGAIIGIPNHGQLRIGATLTEGEQLVGVKARSSLLKHEDLIFQQMSMQRWSGWEANTLATGPTTAGIYPCPE